MGSVGAIVVQYKQAIKNFVNALAKYIESDMNGSVVIMGDNDGWGKVIIEKAQIVSINYGIYRGMQVLPELAKLNELRFMLREAKTGEGDSDVGFVNAGSARISNEEFFSYFGFKVPQVSEVAVNSAKKAALTSIAKEADKNKIIKKHTRGAFREKVLIVDDSIIARKAAAVPLIEYGFDVFDANDGFDALGKLEKEMPDLIILDLIMPGMDGYKVVDLLKRNDKFKDLPIIMVTSKDSLMDRVKGKMSPTDAYITKPFKEGVLLKTVINVLRAHNAT